MPAFHLLDRASSRVQFVSVSCRGVLSLFGITSLPTRGAGLATPRHLASSHSLPSLTLHPSTYRTVAYHQSGGLGHRLMLGSAYAFGDGTPKYNCKPHMRRA